MGFCCSCNVAKAVDARNPPPIRRGVPLGNLYRAILAPAPRMGRMAAASFPAGESTLDTNMRAHIRQLVTTMKLETIRRLIVAAIVFAIAVALIVCLAFSGSATLTNRESVLIGLFVAMLSILVTWIVTHLYSKTDLQSMIAATRKEYSDNIRTFCIKAAEKVLNLSNELLRLRNSVQSGLDDAQDAQTSKEGFALLQERAMATLYVIETLKSMNDTALSDWRGIIGDELQRQELLEKKIADVSKELATLQDKLLVSEDVEPLEDHIRQIEDQLGKMVRQLPFRLRFSEPPPSKGKIQVAVSCPKCHAPNSTRIRSHGERKKAIECISCGAHIGIRSVGNDKWVVTELKPYTFSDKCPVCSNEITGSVIDSPGSMKIITCSKCAARMIISRTPSGINRKIRLSAEIPHELLLAVSQRLPPQPWEKGIDARIAKDLGLSRKMTSRIITALIAKGDFHPQNDGKILPAIVSSAEKEDTDGKSDRVVEQQQVQAPSEQ